MHAVIGQESSVISVHTHIDDVIESYEYSDWLKSFDEYYIKQIDLIFLWVCSLIDAQKMSKCG